MSRGARRPALRWPFVGFAALYVLALAPLAVSTFGLFGQEEDPASGVFLLPLGLPWNALADWLGAEGVAVILLAPLVNVAILYWLWKRRAPAS